VRTDERVRLASEMVNGSLGMKFLSWEAPVYERLTAIRQQENLPQFKTARIRACNTALQFLVTPLVSFATFGTFRARGGVLSVPSVFFCLSLLSLPRLYMVNFFVLAVQFMTELSISLRRIDAFLSTPEPPPPAHQAGGGGAAPGAVKLRGADYAWGLAPPGPEGPSSSSGSGNGSSGSGSSGMGPGKGGGGGGGVAAAPAAAAGAQLRQQGQQGQQEGLAARGSLDSADWQSTYHAPESSVRGGCDFDEVLAAEAAAAGAAEAAAAKPQGAQLVQVQVAAGLGSTQQPQAGAPAAVGPAQKGRPASRRTTLHGISLELQPGELLGVCGEVGSGKSSLLAALLGELQPLQPEGGLLS
jgi:ABC-type multidrug transport system fused ATPase/permease subunit